ncbi:MAG: DUF2520 domain-containing protein [Aureispira sp.]|nr:DUF2520 domain-containing protein [Aureispira sp.]
MYPSISIIGAGNVGHHLTLKLHQQGYNIHQVFSRKLPKAQALAKQVNTEACNHVEEINREADIYIVAIKDDGIASMAEQLSFLNQDHKIVAHTSGATPMTVFDGHFENFGIFYPLQTFSIQKEVNFEQLPFCIDGSNTQTKATLTQLAQSICPNVYDISDQQRNVLHVTAVMVNNFTNHLFAVAQQICKEQQVPFEILHPLIQETTEKIKHTSPKAAQTGPAIRGDQQTIERHLNFLNAYPNYQKIYKMLSQSIQDLHKNL